MTRALLLALLLAGAPAFASPELARHFAKQADLTVSHDRLVMLVLPPEVLAETQPDLSDLRITDREGQEVPFFVEASAPPQPPAVRYEPPGVRAVSRETRTPEGESPFVSERYELFLPEAGRAPRPGERVALCVASRLARFVRSARIEARGPEGPDAPLLAEAALFRLEGAARTCLELPPWAGELAVTIEGRENAYLEPSFSFEALPAAPVQASAAVVELAVSTQASRDGVTTLELVRPLGLVPDALRFESDTAAFSRRATILDLRPDGTRAALGSATLVRIQALSRVESLEVRLFEAAQGEKLRVELADGDSPPLTGVRVFAHVRQPALVFALARHGDGRPDGTLHFGGGQAFRPRYDLASLAELVSDPSQLGSALAEVRMEDVRLGAIRDNASFTPRPALAFAMQPSAALDPSVYSHRRMLLVPVSSNGLVRLRLAPEDVAVARADLADLRVVDARDAQWPILLAAEGAREWRPVAIAPPASARRESRYELTLTAVVADALELETDAPFFDRFFRLVTRGADGAERVLTEGRLERDPERREPVRIALPRERIGSLELRIDDGDDAPLVFSKASLRIVLPELFVTAPPGAYRLLIGDRDAEPPRYELERVRDLVLAVPSTGIQAGPLERNPLWSAARDLASGVRGRTLLVWVALALAVGVLALLTLRAARHESLEEPPA